MNPYSHAYTEPTPSKPEPAYHSPSLVAYRSGTGQDQSWPTLSHRDGATVIPSMTEWARQHGFKLAR